MLSISHLMNLSFYKLNEKLWTSIFVVPCETAQRENFYAVSSFSSSLLVVFPLPGNLWMERVKMAEVAISPDIAYAFLLSSCQSGWNQASYYYCPLVTSTYTGTMLPPYISWSTAQICSGQKQSNVNQETTIKKRTRNKIQMLFLECSMDSHT